jgi:hypothetical protein
MIGKLKPICSNYAIRACFSLVWLIALCLVFFTGCPRRVQLSPKPTGAGVHGSVFVRFSVTGSAKDLGPIYLPDFELFLENVATNEDSAPQTTDLYGRFMFPRQKPGSYQLRWKQQNGWAGGAFPETIVIANNTQYPGPVEIKPAEGSGVLVGTARFGDGSVPRFYDEFFGINTTVAIQASDASGNSVANPGRANAVGLFAIAGLPQTDLAVRASIGAASVQQAIAVSALSFGAASPLNIVFKNRPPQIRGVFAMSGQRAVRVAAPGETLKIAVDANDPDGQPLTFEWKAQEGMGELTPSGEGASWKLPTYPGTYTAFVAASDQNGGFATNRINIRVGATDEVFSGKLVDESGAPIPGAVININGATVASDEGGAFLLKVPIRDRFIMNARKTPEFAPLSRVFRAGSVGQVWKLIRTQVTSVDPTKPIDIVDLRPTLEKKRMKGARIRVPADSLVDAAGNKPSGPISASIATLDIADSEAPGDWRALDGEKEVGLISYGVAFVEFTDAAGTKYNLAQGKRAQVDLAAPQTLLRGARQSAPLWSYDETDGYWKQTGTARLNPVTGIYTGEINLFSTINVDIESNTPACLKVVLDPTIPLGLKLRISNSTGVFAQTFEFVMNDTDNAVYLLPPNAPIKLELLDTSNAVISNLVVEEVIGVPLANNTVDSGPPTPSGNPFPPFPYNDCKAVTLRIDIPAAAGFLIFKGVGSASDAGAYYAAIDPSGLRTTLGDWWTVNGFDLNGDAVGEVRTSYLNDNDLGSGRDMHFLLHADGTVSAYVTNYGAFDQNPGNADLAAGRINPGATVCMEFSPVAQGDTDPTHRIVKFFVYAGNGNGANALRQAGADLDGNGVKFVPNLCTNCHGGTYNPVNPATPTASEINLESSFREFDLATFKYPGFRDAPDAAEETAFKKQNVIVRDNTAPRAAINDLINGWYVGGGTSQDISWNPVNWAGTPEHDLYHDVVEKSCRTCHVAFVSDDLSFGLNWNSFDQFKNRHFSIESYVCGPNRYMPHAKITYNNFWLSTSPSRPAKLRDFSAPGWAPIGTCPQ